MVCATLLWAAVCLYCMTGASSTLEPTVESARHNAFHIFNAVHAVARLWDTAVHHNGFALIPAVVPAGTVLYHGTDQREPPKGPEWLAFTAEHAENFAKRMEKMRDLPPISGLGDHASVRHRSQSPLGPAPLALDDSVPELEHKIRHGYFHTYQAKYDLEVLMLDGMSATSADSEGAGAGGGDLFDVLLLDDELPLDAEAGGNKRFSARESMYDDAQKVCEAVTSLGYHGIVRSEAGVEIIYCDFYDGGIDQVSVVREVSFPERLAEDVTARFQWMRAASRDYDGIGRDRIRVDFSSMVSGLFFPLNFSSPLPNWPDRIRLLSAGHENITKFRTYALEVLRYRGRFNVNWQAVAEAIVDRFSQRLLVLLSNQLSASVFMQEIEGVTLAYLSAESANLTSDEEADQWSEALSRCERLQLLPAFAARDHWSNSDDLLYSAVETVVKDICGTYYQIYANLQGVAPNQLRQGDHANMETVQSPELERVIGESKQLVRHLMNRLDWADWRKPRNCSPEQIFYIALPPWGGDDDHWYPACRSMDYFYPPPIGYW